MQGWIKLHRCLVNKPIWLESTPEQKVILITLLTMANHTGKEWEWKGERYVAQPGQFITSLDSIAHKCGKGITVQNVRTALKRFEKYEFLTNESTNKNRLVTIVNWGIYQDSEDEPNKQTNTQLTSNQQAINKQLTTNKNVKNDKNEKNEKENICYVDIIDYLNQKTQSSYKASTKKTKDLINARYNEGFTLEDFKQVIDNKTLEWLNDPNMNKYLRPETLFGNKFESYLNQKGGGQSGKTKPSNTGPNEIQSKISAANERRKKIAGIQSNRDINVSF